MKITKYGHCCLLIEENGLRILTDPGSYSAGFEEVENIDVVLITHEHGDHFHLESLKAILAQNPQAKVITNHAVGALMQPASLAFESLEDGQTREEKGVKFEGIGTEHAVIYETIPGVLNTGYFIGGTFFYPGDAFTLPERPVDILALPVAGPWMKMSEAIDYARVIKPKTWVPMHDGVARSPEAAFKWPGQILEGFGLKGTFLEQGKEIDL